MKLLTWMKRHKIASAAIVGGGLYLLLRPRRAAAAPGPVSPAVAALVEELTEPSSAVYLPRYARQNGDCIDYSNLAAPVRTDDANCYRCEGLSRGDPRFDECYPPHLRS